jgi:uncharacterized protein with HEPN domain
VADALTACGLVQQFLEGQTYERFVSDQLLRSAVERQLEIIGEALNRAVRADASLADAIPQSSRAIGFRNILAHGYDSVSTAVVWSIASESVPTMERVLSRLLFSAGGSGVHDGDDTAHRG